jgi:hypothetical protein
VLTFEEHRDPACTEHPHCPFDGCGRILADDGSGVLRCPDGCADSLSDDREPAEVVR